MDRLGCALIAQDAELAEANEALETVARLSKVGRSEFASTIQECRALMERADQPRADALARLIACLLESERTVEAMKAEAYAKAVHYSRHKTEARHAREHAGKLEAQIRSLKHTVETVTTYGEAARRNAADEISRVIVANQGKPEGFGRRCLLYVDTVAASLGMRRAEG